jgi:hypothetical protein
MNSREDVIEAIRAEIAANPENAKLPMIGSSAGTLSLSDILAEIESNTDFGQEFVKGWIAAATRGTTNGGKRTR